MSQNLAFYVDAGDSAGLGHVARCWSIAEAIGSHGWTAVFLADEGRGCAWLQARGAVTVPSTRVDVLDRADVVVVDGYQYDHVFVERLARQSHCAALEDWPHGWAVDLVVNPSLHGRELYAESEPRVLAGPEFALIRAEIRDLRPRERHLRPRPERLRVLVTTGGVDPPDAAARIVAALAHYPAPMEVRLHVGPLVRGRPEMARSLEIAAAAELSVEEGRPLGESFLWSDVVFCGASTVCLEAATIGVPGFVVALALNQLPVARAAQQRGMFTALDAGDLAVTTIVDSLNTLTKSEDDRSRMVDRQRRTVDGCGAERVAKRIIGLTEESD